MPEVNQVPAPAPAMVYPQWGLPPVYSGQLRYGEKPPDLRPTEQQLADRGISLQPGIYKIVLAGGGTSDKIIKISPWRCNEKLWLDNQNGIARWELIKRILYTHIPRNESVPEPVSYHAGNDLKTIVITPSDIPLAKLENFEPMKQPEENAGIELLPDNHPDVPGHSSVRITSESLMADSEKIKRLEKEVEELKKLQNAKPYHCDQCDKNFESKALHAMHMGRFHKAE